MNASVHALNRFLAQAKPSATYKVMDRVAARRSAGAQVISLCAGEPDFDTPGHVREAGIAAIRAGHTRYTQVAGLRALREAIAAKFQRENGLELDWRGTLVCSGGKQAIFNALAATLNEGDEVIMPAPYWVSYPEIVQLCGGKAITVACNAGNGFKLTPAALQAAITPRTRWLILNSPSNPTGAVYSRAELQALAEVLLAHPHVLVLSDDIYEHLIFDGLAFFTIAQVEPRLRERVLTMNGVSKAYAMTGWRLGYAGGPKALIKAMSTLISQSTSCVSAISQSAARVALTADQGCVREAAEVFHARRDRIEALLDAVPGIRCPRPQGAFYVYPSVEGLLGKRTADGRELRTDLDVVMFLLDDAGVAVLDGAAYGLSPYLRLSFATSMENIEEGCRRIREACAGLI